MATIKISGIPGLDGEYPFEGDMFTNRELHTIKRLAGVRAGDLQEAFEHGDNDLAVAIAVICLQRAGKPFDENMLWDAPVGAFDVEGEEDESPPAQTPPASESETSAAGESSGSASPDAGDTSPERDQNVIGFPDSATGSA